MEGGGRARRDWQQWFLKDDSLSGHSLGGGGVARCSGSGVMQSIARVLMLVALSKMNRE